MKKIISLILLLLILTA
ncbi:lipoprotein, partial [Listeria monocytogenes]